MESDRVITIIDTNVFLGTGDEVFSKLENRDFVIPLMVYRELEKARTTKQDGRAYAARTVIRMLERLRTEHPDLNMSTDEIPVGHGNTVRVEIDNRDHSVLKEELRDDKTPDMEILAVAKNLSLKESRKVELITNDTPLGFIASTAEGIESSQYETENDGKYTGKIEVDLSEINAKRSENGEDGWLECGQVEDEEYEDILAGMKWKNRPYHALLHVTDSVSEDWIIKNGSEYSEFNASQWPSAGPIHPRNLEQAVAISYLKDPGIQMISLGGVAGAGKSLLAISYGLDAVEDGLFSKVTVFRSMYAVGRQEQGFLRGDADDKMRPWAQAVWDDVKKYDRTRHAKSEAAAKKALKSAARSEERMVMTPDGKSVPAIEAKYADKITVEPITYLRGRTLENQLVIVDDAQSLDRSILLDVISRLGEGSKIVFTFDMDQQDNPYLSSGTSIESLIQRLKSEPCFAHMDFEHSERSALAQLASRLLSELGS